MIEKINDEFLSAEIDDLELVLSLVNKDRVVIDGSGIHGVDRGKAYNSIHEIARLRSRIYNYRLLRCEIDQLRKLKSPDKGNGCICGATTCYECGAKI